MTFRLSIPIRVTQVLEHSRTIHGGKDSLGQPYTESVNLGWFIHLELETGEPFGVALGVGTERPSVQPGDTMTLALTKR